MGGSYGLYYVNYCRRVGHDWSYFYYWFNGISCFKRIYVARYCDDQFGTLLAVGISSMIGVQAFINLSVTSGLLPITGVPLPFISYGGSSLIVLMISMGILNNIAKDSNEHFESDYKLDVKNSTDN